ncbi:MAG: hypothetical protein LBL18_03415, partial [Bacteroidales bacterium]|nr:hypothetical protein [Bacteroidales bacterium]
MTVRQKREQIEELMESLQNIDFNTKEVREAIMANEDEIIRMQQEQMWAGITAGGQSIEPFYEPRTVKAKQKKGQPTDRV